MNDKQLMGKFISDINIVSARCLRIFSYSLMLFFAYFFFVVGVDVKKLIVVLGIVFLIGIFPTLIVNGLKMSKNYFTRHFIILASVSIMTTMITEFQLYAYALILFPLLVAALYFDRTFVLYTAMLTALGILVSALVRYYYGAQLLFKTTSRVRDVFQDMALPNILIVSVLSIITFFVVDINSKYIKTNEETAITMLNNEKGLIFALSEISENKSKLTGEHIKRVSEYMRVMALAAGFEEDYADKLATAAMAHDIGKLMISEEILDKPTKLTKEEYQIMRNHVLYGDALLEKCPGEILHLARIMAKEHHEKWDGTGYLGMKGEEIAFISRMIAVCDVFDALTAERMYKKGWSLEDAYDEIVRCSGTAFDPEIVKLFTENFDKIRAIHDMMPDKQIY
ncbi:MAG: HD-GYP domain-containing protein [Eubacterium sp.]|nr:HD-GYP domain-containing protein [Eubacterium sp.]MCR5292133.1 HD-GYP domain-containing protein [Eubacterium sp.]